MGKIIVGLLLALFAFPRSAQTEDIQQTILLLPDEAAECRYLEALRGIARSSLASLEENSAKADQEYQKGNYAAAAAIMHGSAQGVQKYMVPNWLKVTEALQIIRIKRGELPQCSAKINEEVEPEIIEAAKAGTRYARRLQEMLQAAQR